MPNLLALFLVLGLLHSSPADASLLNFRILQPCVVLLKHFKCRFFGPQGCLDENQIEADYNRFEKGALSSKDFIIRLKLYYEKVDPALKVGYAFVEDKKMGETHPMLEYFPDAQGSAINRWIFELSQDIRDIRVFYSPFHRKQNPEIAATYSGRYEHIQMDSTSALARQVNFTLKHEGHHAKLRLALRRGVQTPLHVEILDKNDSRRNLNPEEILIYMKSVQDILDSGIKNYNSTTKEWKTFFWGILKFQCQVVLDDYVGPLGKYLNDLELKKPSLEETNESDKKKLADVVFKPSDMELLDFYKISSNDGTRAFLPIKKGMQPRHDLAEFTTKGLRSLSDSAKLVALEWIRRIDENNLEQNPPGKFPDKLIDTKSLDEFFKLVKNLEY